MVQKLEQILIECIEEPQEFINPKEKLEDFSIWDSLTAMIFIDRIKETFGYSLSVEQVGGMSLIEIANELVQNGISE